MVKPRSTLSSCSLRAATHVFQGLGHNVYSFHKVNIYVVLLVFSYTGLFISPSGISKLDCATTKTDTAERSISIGRESFQVFFVL